MSGVIKIKERKILPRRRDGQVNTTGGVSSSSSSSTPSGSSSVDIDAYTKEESDSKFGMLEGGNDWRGNQNIEGNLLVKGNVVQTGDTFITKAEKIEIKENVSMINKGEVNAGVSSCLSDTDVRFAGWGAYRGPLNPFYWGLDDTNPNRPLWKIGKKDSLQRVLTGEDAPLDNGVMVWDIKRRMAVAVSKAPNSELLDGMKSDEFVHIEGEQTIKGNKYFMSPQFFNEIIIGKDSVPGWEGFGGLIKKDKDGRVSMEIDNLSVRQTAKFYEMLVKKYRVVGGTLFVSNGEKSADAEDCIIPGIFGMDGSFNVEGVLYRSLEFKI
jgi:hypothetical protein